MDLELKNKYAKFAEVYNDTTAYPYVSDVAKKLSMGERTVRSYAAMLRGQLADGKDVPTLISRKAKSNETRVAGEEHREIVSSVSSYEEPIEDLLSRVMEHNEKYAAYHSSKNCVDVKIKFDGPYGIVGLPDNHLNNTGTLIRKAFDDAYIINQHPHLFAVGIGDWLDNFIVGFLERERRKDIMSHSDSWRILEHYLNILAPKIVIGISGNHMDWTTSAGGVDVMKKMFEDHGLGAVYDTDEARVRLISPNGTSFTHLARHKYRGNSRFNSVHGITVQILENWQGEDVVWGGHIHAAGHVSIEKQWMGESRVVHGIQLGAYKNIDEYAKREGFRRNMPFLVPMVVHIPETGETVFFEDMNRGIEFLEMTRKNLGYK